MKSHLLFVDRDLDSGWAPPANAGDLESDLSLEQVYGAMALGDRFLNDTARRLLLAPLREPVEIRYRQAVLADCVSNPDTVRALHQIAVEAIERDKHEWLFGMDRPDSVLGRSVRVMGYFVEALRKLRAVAETASERFESPGFRNLFRSLSEEVDEAYLHDVEAHLSRLDGRSILMSGRLGAGNVGTGYVLRRPPRRKLLERLFGDRSGFEFEIDGRDEGGTQALGALRMRGIALSATALARSSDHILSFFEALRLEVGFYVGCLNLREWLVAHDLPACFPEPLPATELELAAVGLSDPSLGLAGAPSVVGSDVTLAGKDLIVITGANRGGKSTFLRGLGLAQLMMQAGMFVAAESFRSEVRGSIFTHYRREEDATMTRGKLEEELARARDLVGMVRPGDLVLFNESFASTNEREGSEIARQIVHALVDSGVKVAYVTHLYDLARSLRAEARAGSAFLRAERLPDGRRTFRIVPGEPLSTSHGPDLYDQIFGETRPEARSPALAAPGDRLVAVDIDEHA
jgi:hypothetical protein